MKPIWTQVTSQPKVELGIFVRLEKDTKGSYLLSALLPLWWRSFGDSSSVSVILALVMDRSFNDECLSITWEISWLARHASINRPLHEGIWDYINNQKQPNYDWVLLLVFCLPLVLGGTVSSGTQFWSLLFSFYRRRQLLNTRILDNSLSGRGGSPIDQY